jgi:predicted PhzF superfamily epimerase YddE/YHI9
MTTPRVHLVSVFASGPNGGNPAPIVADAAGMSDEDMQAVARASGHESGFVLPAPPGSDCDFGIRFWPPSAPPRIIKAPSHRAMGHELGHVKRSRRPGIR